MKLNFNEFENLLQGFEACLNSTKFAKNWQEVLKPYMKVFNRVGVELEGLYQYKLPWIEDYLHGDGSIWVEDEYEAGERSTYAYRIQDFESLLKEIYIFFPEVVNSSCGYHINISFSSEAYYQGLLSSEAFDSILYLIRQDILKHYPQYYKNWRARLEEGCDFSQLEYWGDIQVTKFRKSTCRYTAINFCYQFNKRIEVRYLGMPYMEKVAMDLLIIVLKNIGLVALKNKKKSLYRCSDYFLYV